MKAQPAPFESSGMARALQDWGVRSRGGQRVLSETTQVLGLPAGDAGSNSPLFQLLRSPDASATFLISSKKNMNLPILFPDGLPKVLKFFVIEKNPIAVLGGHGM